MGRASLVVAGLAAGLAAPVLAGCSLVFPISVPEADEDKDGILDDEDLCPQLAARDIMDADGDGIGDPCDPRPLDGADVRLLFTGFARGVPPELELVGGGGGALVDGAFELSDVNDDTEIIAGLNYTVDIDRPHVDVGIDVVEVVEPDSSYAELSIVIGHLASSPQVDQGVNCFYGVNPAFEVEPLLAIWGVPAEEDLGITFDIAPAFVGESGPVTFGVDASRLTCAAAGTTLESSRLMEAAELSGRVGVTSNGLVIRLRYLDIIAAAP